MSTVHPVSHSSNSPIYPQYYQYTAAGLSYIFKFKNPSSIDLKVYNVSQDCIVRHSLPIEKLGREYIDRISHTKDLSIVLDHLVKTGVLAREHFPIYTKIDQVDQLIKTKDWALAEKAALEGLKGGNESEKVKYYELLEEIYNNSNPGKLEHLWSLQGEDYIKLSRFDEAEKVYEKAFRHVKNFSSAYNLAHILNIQKKINKSVQTYYEAATIALFEEKFEKVSLCIRSIREIDPQMEILDSSQKLFLLMQSQLLKISEELQTQQRSLFQFLALAPAQHQPNLLESILYTAVNQDRVDVVKMIAQYWDLVPINTCYGHQPLIITAVQKGNEEMVRTLITHPAINIHCTQNTGHHLTALAAAEQAGFKNILNLLHQHSMSLEQDFNAFKKKPLGVIEYLHIHILNSCLVVTGLDPEGDRKLLHISYPLKQSLQQELEQLVARGLSVTKYVTINPSSSYRGIGQLAGLFPQAQTYEAQPSKTENPYHSDSMKIRTQFEVNIANHYEELSKKIDDLVKNACAIPANEAVVYRAIMLKSKGYFKEDKSDT